jgi:hypothetical protein
MTQTGWTVDQAPLRVVDQEMMAQTLWPTVQIASQDRQAVDQYPQVPPLVVQTARQGNSLLAGQD